MATMTQPTFDAAGYPTEETLQAIREWDSSDMPGLFEFIEQAWEHPEHWKTEGARIEAVTCGWSGNESLIDALESNFVAWGLCWEESMRGGYYVFEIPASQMKGKATP